MAQIIGLAAAGYLLGSIPTAWIITKLVTGKDLRQLGSGNVGVMNTALSVTRWAGLIVFLGEIAKGIGAVVLATVISGSELAISITVLFTVIGTRRMVWLGFAGGRGTTSGIAALLLISWQALLISTVLWAAARIVTGRSFVSTRILLLTRPFILGAVTQSWVYFLFGIALSGVYLTTHAPETDDHDIIKESWPSLWAFITGPKRKER